MGGELVPANPGGGRDDAGDLLQDEESLACVDLVEREDVEGWMPDARIKEQWGDLLPELRAANRPWSRMEGESPRAYTAFLIYLRLGPMVRTKRLVSSIYRSLMANEPPDYMVEEGEDGQETIRETKREKPKKTERGFVNNLDGKVLRSDYCAPYVHKWSSRYEWERRILLWDNYFHSWVMEHERDLRRSESALMAQERRVLRSKWRKVLIDVFTHAERLMSGELNAKDFRDVVLALDRAGLIQEKIFEGVKDILDESADDQPLPPEIAGNILAFLRGGLNEIDSLPRVHAGPPRRQLEVIDGEIVER